MNKYQEALDKANKCGDGIDCIDCKYNESCAYGESWYKTLKEAIDKANKYDELQKVYFNNEPMESADLNGVKLQELYDFNSKLIDKATQKKIIKINAKDNPNVKKGSLTDMVGFTYQCPTCKENMSFLSVYNYCQYCGQALDRSDE